MAICITGTPGTGKTSISKILSKKIGYKIIDVTKLVKENRLYDCYDKKSKSFVVDTEKLNKTLIDIIKTDNKVIIDSHLSHYLPKKYVELCIVTKCNLKELKKRLEKRRYPKAKVRENLDSEIFDVCLNEAREEGHNVFVISTSKSEEINTEKDIKKIIISISKLE